MVGTHVYPWGPLGTPGVHLGTYPGHPGTPSTSPLATSLLGEQRLGSGLLVRAGWPEAGRLTEEAGRLAAPAGSRPAGAASRPIRGDRIQPGYPG